MKQIRFWAAVIICLFGLAKPASAQQFPIAVQHIYFSLFNDYEDDLFFYNATPTNSTYTNEVSLIRTANVILGNVDRSLYYDLAGGPTWTNLEGMELVREVNLTNGAEGIYLRGNGRQTNVSQFFTNAFGPSYLNDFTSQVTNEFAGYTNNFTPDLPIRRDSVQFRKGQVEPLTNSLRLETMFFMSMNTTNLKFNYLGYGTLVHNPVRGRFVPGGTLYSNNVDSFVAHGIGTMFRTGGTNVFNPPGSLPPVTNTGPMSGTIWTGAPFFLGITNADAPQ